MEGMAHTLAYDLTLSNDGVAPVERLARVNVPTLAMAGGNSAPWALEAARTISSTVPGATERVIEGQDHSIPGAAIAPVLRAFFS